jgi:hypothetical protein
MGFVKITAIAWSLAAHESVDSLPRINRSTAHCRFIRLANLEEKASFEPNCASEAFQ